MVGGYKDRLSPANGPIIEDGETVVLSIEDKRIPGAHRDIARRWEGPGYLLGITPVINKG